MIAARFVNRCICFNRMSPYLRKRAAAIVGVYLMLVGLPTAAYAQSESIEYYGLDAVGSVRVVFDPNGNVLGRMDYGPFGNKLAPSTAKQQSIYAGLFVDDEAATHHADARSYQVRSGRFTAADPVYAGLFNPQAWNRYAYALNNPVSFSDPSGLQEESTPSCGQQSVVRGDDGVWRHTSNCPGGSGSNSGSSSGGPSQAMLDMQLWFLTRDYGGGSARGDSSSVSIEEIYDGALSVRSTVASAVVEEVLQPAKDYAACQSEPALSSCGNALMAAASVLPAGKAAAGLKRAVALYPAKALKTEWHHVIPKYLGGAVDGVRVEINAAYHQLITNEFRELWAYGMKQIPSPSHLKQIIIDVYNKYPIPWP